MEIAAANGQLYQNDHFYIFTIKKQTKIAKSTKKIIKTNYLKKKEFTSGQ